LDRDTARADTFRISQPLADLIGLRNSANRTYNVKNIAAYLGRNNEHVGRRDAWLWGGGRSGQDVISNGVFVSLNPVPNTDGAWATNPYEAQFLKVYDVTQLPAPNAPPQVEAYALDGNVTFSWNPVIDPEGLQPLYKITVTRSDNTVQNFETTATSFNISELPPGVTATATITTLNPNKTDVASPATPSSPETLSLTSTGDEDGDGISNAAEVTAGTNPLDPTSRFRLENLAPAEGGGFTLDWQVVPGRTYAVERSTTLGEGSWTTLASGLTVGTYTDTNPPAERAFYRIRASR
jgi:hypothetical protein